MSGFWDQLSDTGNDPFGDKDESQPGTFTGNGIGLIGVPNEDPSLKFLCDNAQNELKSPDEISKSDIHNSLIASGQTFKLIIKKIQDVAEEANIHRDDVLPITIGLIAKILSYIINTPWESIIAIMFVHLGRHYPEIADQLLENSDMTPSGDGIPSSRGHVTYDIFDKFMEKWVELNGNRAVVQGPDGSGGGGSNDENPQDPFEE